MAQSRWLSPQAAARHLDVRIDALPRLVKAKRIPAPDYSLGPRSPRYDREALDKRMAGGVASRDPDKALEAWREKRAQRQGRAA